NREMLLPQPGRVVIFAAAEGGVPPGVYQTATVEAAAMLKRGCDLHEPETFERYFRLLFGTVGEYLDNHNIHAAPARFDSPLVAEKFRMIEDDTVPAVVRPEGYGDVVDKLLDQIRSRGEEPQRAFRKLQPYVVSLRNQAMPFYQREHLLEEVIPGWG